MILKNSIFFFKTAIRERSYVFWCIAFPVILLVMLVIIFSAMYKVERINFNLYLIKPESGQFSDIISEIFQKLSTGDKKIFNLKTFKNFSSKEKLIEDLKKGKTNLIVEIPEGFDSLVLSNITFRMLGLSDGSSKVLIYTLRHNVLSQSASMVIKNIFQKFNLEFVKRIAKVKEYRVNTEIVGSKMGFSYVDFIYPGIVILAIFFSGLMGIGQELAWFKEGKILKRFNVTPINYFSFFASYFLARFYFFVLQVLVLTFVCKIIYKTTVNPLSFNFIFYVLLSMVTLSALGFFVSSMAKNVNSAAVIVQILQFPLQFLGGIYFPVFDVPWIIRWIVVINPITYLAAGVRDTLGIMPSPYPLYLTIIIPLIYIVVFLFLGIKKYKGEEFS